MTQPPPQPGKEQQLLRHARRESLLIMALWALCLVWSVGSAYVLGYNRDPDTVRLILGMPDWVFWSVVLPWALCLLFSVWFCFAFMADDDLGQDPDEGHGHA
ncbi:MAG TPA: DUF997 family protein [Gemmataceae bacterium]|nr:DUF997 family protein [Gemmataceae bacterium]